MALLESMWGYMSTHYDDVARYIMEHLYMVGVSEGIALLIATILAVVSRTFQRLGLLIVGFFNMTYAIPSLALFALLMPYTGLGKSTAIVCIIIYEQFLLLKNIISGFDSISPAVIEAAQGMGMGRMQCFWQVKLPLALPSILNGIKLALLSAIGIAVIGAFISAGGIGALIYDGLRRNYTAKIVWGTIISTALAVAVNQLFQLLERLALVKARGGYIFSARS